MMLYIKSPLPLDICEDVAQRYGHGAVASSLVAVLPILDR